MRLLNLLVAAVALPGLLGGLLSRPAAAQPFQGVYLGAGAGYHITNDVRAAPFPASALGGTGLRLRTNGGFAGLGSLGYGFGNGWRLELEGSARLNNLGHLNGTPFPTSPGGSLQTYALMANALFDLDVRSPWIYPYVGGGIGAAWNAASGLRATSANPLFGFGSSDTAMGLAVQAIAGLSFPIPNTPGLSLTAEYRLFSMPITRTLNGSAATPAGNVPAGLKLGTMIDQSALIGVRYAFGVQPPPSAVPVAAAPAPAEARSFLVFFDWDKAVLTERARQIIREAADTSRKVQTTRIEVNGYTDSSGAPGYNKTLSLRRAQVVAGELVKDGVAREAIHIEGFGESNPLVPTAKGVREPHNRRVEIHIR
jgi:OOP family OmpA-OmpF porin